MLSHYLMNLKSFKIRWEPLLCKCSYYFGLICTYIFFVILRVHKTQKSGVTWVYSEDRVQSTALPPVSISASYCCFSFYHHSVSVHLNVCKTWVGFTMDTCQNQPQQDISLNFEYKAGRLYLVNPCQIKDASFWFSVKFAMVTVLVPASCWC